MFLVKPFGIYKFFWLYVTIFFMIIFFLNILETAYTLIIYVGTKVSNLLFILRSANIKKNYSLFRNNINLRYNYFF